MKKLKKKEDLVLVGYLEPKWVEWGKKRAGCLTWNMGDRVPLPEEKQPEDKPKI